jgi:hypothetical protein
VQQPYAIRGQRALDATRLVSCCAGLQSLDMSASQCSTDLLPALPGLNRLHTLHYHHILYKFTPAEVLEVFRQLPGLRELSVTCACARREDLLQPLTRLTRLTRLMYKGPVAFGPDVSHMQVILCHEVSAVKTSFCWFAVPWAVPQACR